MQALLFFEMIKFQSNELVLQQPSVLSEFISFLFLLNVLGTYEESLFKENVINK